MLEDSGEQEGTRPLRFSHGAQVKLWPSAHQQQLAGIHDTQPGLLGDPLGLEQEGWMEKN